MTNITKIKYSKLNNKNNTAASFLDKDKNNTIKADTSDNILPLYDIPSDKFGIFTSDIIDDSYKNYYETLLNNSIEYVIQENKQLLNDDVFYIRMSDYSKNREWASGMNLLTCVVSMLIFQGKSFEEILAVIEKEIRNINYQNDCAYFFGRQRKGVHIFPFIQNARGSEYLERYLEKFNSANKENKINGMEFTAFIAKSNDEYKEANVCEINSIFPYGLTIYQKHPLLNKEKNLDFAKKEFEKLRTIKNPSEEQINKTCATIQWLIAQETPYERGSDSIACVLTKAIYHAHDMFISPVKEGKSLDFEAFDTDLNNYIQIYPDLFEKRPHKILNTY